MKRLSKRHLQKLISHAAKSGMLNSKEKMARARAAIDNIERTLPPCHVYVIEAKDTGLIKIGISERLDKRMTDLKNTNAADIELYVSLQARNKRQAHEIELKAHAKLAEFRKQGEWFQVEPQIAVQAVRDSWPTPESLDDL
jgi:T5orf172 domain